MLRRVFPLLVVIFVREVLLNELVFVLILFLLTGFCCHEELFLESTPCLLSELGGTHAIIDVVHRLLVDGRDELRVLLLLLGVVWAFLGALATLVREFADRANFSHIGHVLGIHLDLVLHLLSWGRVNNFRLGLLNNPIDSILRLTDVEL